jgi:ketosteroid isomerase-like protein
MNKKERIESKNCQMMQDVYNSYNNHELEPVLAALSEDTEWVAIGSRESLPYAGVYRGPKEVLRYLDILADAEESNHLVPQEFIGHGDRVIIFGEYIARVNATGVQFKTDFVHVFTLSDGKIVKFRDFYDTAAAVAAFNAPPIERQPEE